MDIRNKKESDQAVQQILDTAINIITDRNNSKKEAYGFLQYCNETHFFNLVLQSLSLLKQIPRKDCKYLEFGSGAGIFTKVANLEGFGCTSAQHTPIDILAFQTIRDIIKSPKPIEINNVLTNDPFPANFKEHYDGIFLLRFTAFQSLTYQKYNISGEQILNIVDNTFNSLLKHTNVLYLAMNNIDPPIFDYIQKSFHVDLIAELEPDAPLSYQFFKVTKL
jgi:hypothetical protein